MDKELLVRLEKNYKQLTVTIERYNANINELDKIVRFKKNSEGEFINAKEYIDAQIKLIDNAKKETLEQQENILKMYLENGGEIDDLEIKLTTTNEEMGVENNEGLINIKEETINEVISKESEKLIMTEKVVSITTETDDIVYDLIPLPSKGECYKHKISKLPVTYLTAYDENLITSMNLYYDNLFIDFLLKEKIKYEGINPEDLVKGDRDEILLWLRTTGYGNEYPVVVTDPLTNTEFETIVDLNQIKTKPFNLVGDENGYFDFKLPLSGDNIKFKFLTSKEEKQLEVISEFSDNDTKKNNLNRAFKIINDALKNENELDDMKTQEITKLTESLEEWVNSVKGKNPHLIHNKLTNKLELSIVSINGNDDRLFIHKYIKTMKAKDSLTLRRYIMDNEPGLDFNIEIERPETLGGGSFKTFLTIDQFLFLYFQ